MIVVEPFAPRHLPDFRKLFEDSCSPCFCRYWHFLGTKNEWLERCAERSEDNFSEQAAAALSGDASAGGLVAIDSSAGHSIVGWMKLAPRKTLTKLTSLPVYRALAAEEATWTIGCFLVRPGERRRGVARALLIAAEDYVRNAGGLILEGLPRRSSEPIHDEEAWQGPERLFVEREYVAVHDVAPYPVYRKVLVAS